MLRMGKREVVSKMQRPSVAWKVTQLERNVSRVEIPYDRSAKWEAWALLSGDRHVDNPKSNLDLQAYHLDQVIERGAFVIDVADLYDCMGGKYDKRANKSSLRPEHQGENYFDLVVNSTVEFLKPYAKHFVMIGMGNHEQAIVDKHEINLIDRTVGILNRETGSRIYNGGYGGYVLINFRNKFSRSRTLITLKYQHGVGGGAPVTGGVIDSYRKAVSYPDADIYVSGHTHDSFIREIQRERICRLSGNRRFDIQTQIKTPSYKDDHGDNYGGWANAKMGMGPKPLGAYWLRFFWDWRSDRVLYETIKAQ